MVRINLLPWREELRKQKQQDFIAAIGAGLAITSFLFLIAYLHIEGMNEYQQSRNTILQNEIKIVDKKISEIKNIEAKKRKLLTKIEVIQKLQESRPEIVHLFDDLAKFTPQGVYLTSFKQVGAALSLKGKAQSNARVSAYMRDIENAPWLSAPVLQVIENKKKGGGSNDFSLNAKQGGQKPQGKKGKK